MESADRCTRMHNELKELIGKWAEDYNASLPELLGVLSVVGHEYCSIACAGAAMRGEGEPCQN